MTFTLATLFDRLSSEFPDAVLHGDSSLNIVSLSPLESADSSSLTFLSHPKYTQKLSQSKAACVIVGPSEEVAAIRRGACIVASNPYFYFARLTQVWKRLNSAPKATGIHPSAFIDPLAYVAPDAYVGAFACISAGALVASGAHIGEHCVIGQSSVVGKDTRFSARVTLGDRCTVGERCIVHSGAVIGADGFGFAPHGGHWEKIEQLGSVRIGNDVEIGANTCIDRGSLQDTVIEEGVKLDNLIQVGHNVRIGAHSALAGCVGVAGSANIGAHCTIGGGAIVLGHLSLADHVHISAASVVTRSILKAGNYTGLFPIDDNAVWEKNAATIKQLHLLRDRLRAVEKAISYNNT